MEAFATTLALLRGSRSPVSSFSRCLLLNSLNQKSELFGRRDEKGREELVKNLLARTDFIIPKSLHSRT